MKLIELYNEIKINTPNQIFNGNITDEDESFIYYLISSKLLPFKLIGQGDKGNNDFIIIDFHLEDDDDESILSMSRQLEQMLSKYNISYKKHIVPGIYTWINIPKKYFKIT